MTRLYVATPPVCFSVCLWKHPHYLTIRARWRRTMALCQNRSMPKVWTDNGGSQCLVIVETHSCLPSQPPRCTIKPLPFRDKLINDAFVLAPNQCFVFIFGTDAFLFASQTSSIFFYFWTKKIEDLFTWKSHWYLLDTSCTSMWRFASCVSCFLHFYC